MQISSRNFIFRRQLRFSILFLWPFCTFCASATKPSQAQYFLRNSYTTLVSHSARRLQVAVVGGPEGVLFCIYILVYLHIHIHIYTWHIATSSGPCVAAKRWTRLTKNANNLCMWFAIVHDTACYSMCTSRFSFAVAIHMANEMSKWSRYVELIYVWPHIGCTQWW